MIELTGQELRNRVVAEGFDGSWALMLRSADWWPSSRQVRCTELIREAGSPSAAVSLSAFPDAVGSSLRQWRAFRGARFDPQRLRTALQSVAPLLPRWQETILLTVSPDQLPELFDLFDATSEVKPTSRKWVATSKLLHHLLPDLIPPMDNRFTAPFMGLSSLPAVFDRSFLVDALAALVDVIRNPDYGTGAQRIKAAAKEVPYPLNGARLVDCRVGLARVLDFAVAGCVSRIGGPALRSTKG